MVVSLNAPAVQGIHDVRQAIAVAREAEVRRRPDRFAGLADWFDTVPLHAADRERIGRTNAINLFKLKLR
jgi:hypothetical protein